MRVSAYEINLPLENDNILLINGLYGAYDIIEKENAEKINVGDFEGIPVELKDRLIRRGHITDKDESEEIADMKLLSRIYKMTYGKIGVGVIIMPTYDCNFRCPYCYEQHRLKKGTDWLNATMSEDMIDAVFEGLKKYRAKGFIVDQCTLYGGEPLLEKNFDAVKKITERSEELGLKLSAITNGYELNGYLDLLAKCNVDFLQITIDGVGEINDRRRIHKDGLKTYEKILENVKLALERGLGVSLRVNVGRENLGGIKDLIDDLKKRGLTAKDKFHFYFKATNDDRHPENNVNEFDIIGELQKLGYTKAEIRNLHTSYGKHYGNLKRLFKNKTYGAFGPAFCGSEQGMLVIDPYGDLYTCWDFVGMTEKSVGFVDKDSKRFMLNFESVKWRMRTADNMEKCQKCPYCFICQGGCAARAQSEEGDPFRESCGEIKELFNFAAVEVANEFLKENPKENRNLELSLSYLEPLSKISEEDRETMTTTKSQKEIFELAKKYGIINDDNKNMGKKKGKTLKTKTLVKHLRRQYLPELMDDKCVAALKNIEDSYGETDTYTGYIEVRLGEEARYVDYVILTEENRLPVPISTPIWYEFDYEQFSSGKKMTPCLFFSLEERFKDCYKEIFAKTLPSFFGEQRTKNIMSELNKVIRTLPAGSFIKHIGAMNSRKEREALRLAIHIRGRENLRDFLVKMDWKGDAKALWEIIKTWEDEDYLSLDFDLSEKGISEKIGIELPMTNNLPFVIDMYISYLEAKGWCLKSKGDAIRRWIRLAPCPDPFIQTELRYFKFNYMDGKIIEVKAYFEQSFELVHNFFREYERPKYAEFVLKDENGVLSVGEAMKNLYDCIERDIRSVKFVGDTTSYEHLDRLLEECNESELFASVEISESAGKVTKQRLESLIEAGAKEFVTDIGNVSALKILRELNFEGVKATWFMDGENFGELKEKANIASKFGVKELIITGMRPEFEAKSEAKSALSREALEFASNFIKERQKSAEGIKLTVDPCFSVLKAFMGGEDAKQNPNRGIERGCAAGRDHFCVTSDGKFAPCRFLAGEKSQSIEEYWNNSETLKKLRSMEENREPQCKGCTYERRCLPCPAPKVLNCPLNGKAKEPSEELQKMITRCRTAEGIIELAKTEDIELTMEQAEAYLERTQEAEPDVKVF